MDDEQIKIIIAEDQVLFRELLKEHLTKQGFSVVADVSNGLEALVKVKKYRPDIVLMDIDMPLFNGVQASKAIREELPEIKIIVITAISDIALYTALKPYVNGYLKKVISIDVIEDAIVRVYNGEDYFFCMDEEIAAQEYSNMVEDEEKEITIDELTERENDIVRCVGLGMSNDEIGRRLFVSERTVKYHLTNIFRKLKVANKVELMNYLVKKGFLK